jgi:hypothetical protein
VPTLPITREAGEAWTVVMCLGQNRRPISSLPDLAGGDLLRAMAEVEVTTDSAERLGIGRVGKRYGYDPVVEARLLLAGDPDATEADGRRALSIGEPQRIRCTQLQHHRVVFFDQLTRVREDGLPWRGASSINLALSAHHPEAEPGQVLLVGENEPDGSVLGDKGRISAVRMRGGTNPSHPVVREPASRVSGIPVQKGVRTVVYSLRIGDIGVHEPLAIKARMITSAAHLGYPARVSSRLFLADAPDQDEPGGRAAKVAALRGVITPRNGFNCLPERNPCETLKAGITYIRRAPGRDLFANLVTVSADPFGGARRGDALEVVDGGLIEAVRYPPG